MPVSNVSVCPRCRGLSIRIANLNREAAADDYRCSGCGYVWRRMREDAESTNDTATNITLDA